jgi:hypothetical protein
MADQFEQADKRQAMCGKTEVQSYLSERIHNLADSSNFDAEPGHSPAVSVSDSARYRDL